MEVAGMNAIVLQAWREQQGLTRKQAARLLGTTATTIYRWEAQWKRGGEIPQSSLILLCLLHDQKNIRKVEDFLFKSLGI